MSSRRGQIERKTKETDINLSIELDGTGTAEIEIGLPFFEHMLNLFARHGFFDLKIKASGDLEIDGHHTVEDIGLCLGQAVKQALGEMQGIRRYGNATVPMEESLASVDLDVCNRPNLVFNAPVINSKIGNYDYELTKEFFNAFTTNSGTTLHVNLKYGENLHHIAESIFKAFGRALDMATAVDPRIKGVHSTKELL
jgi:imidazoleglycerol-phosphate dehydratase